MSSRGMFLDRFRVWYCGLSCWSPGGGQVCAAEVLVVTAGPSGGGWGVVGLGCAGCAGGGWGFVVCGGGGGGGGVVLPAPGFPGGGGGGAGGRGGGVGGRAQEADPP